MPLPGADGDADPLDAPLRDLTDRQRADDAAEARRRGRWLRRQAEEEGSLAGVLLDLGERDQAIALSTVTGRTLRGVIRTIGADFVGLRGPGGEGSLVPLLALTAIRTEPGATGTVGDRVVAVDTSLGAVLADLAADRPWVALHTVAGEGVAGELLSAGTDVLRVRSPAGATTYVPLATLADVVLP